MIFTYCMIRNQWISLYGKRKRLIHSLNFNKISIYQVPKGHIIIYIIQIFSTLNMHTKSLNNELNLKISTFSINYKKNKTRNWLLQDFVYWSDSKQCKCVQIVTKKKKMIVQQLQKNLDSFETNISDLIKWLNVIVQFWKKL